MDPYIRVNCLVDDTLREALTALLSQLPFQAFEEKENTVLAYLPASNWNETMEKELRSIQSMLPFTFRIEHLPAKNWNSYWESRFDPVIIPGFCTVRAPFHDIVVDTPVEIIMQPKMSFGTGHHETTRLMMESMRNLDFKGKEVLDFGAGTGILAILAAKMGACSVDAVEIDKDSFLNLKENVERNHVDITTLMGGIELLGQALYDILLVNITRNTILGVLPVLSSLTKPAGILICSGFLEEDVPIITERAEDFSFQQTIISGRNWSAISFFKK